MKKTLTLLLALLLACSVIFTGCGKSNSSDDTDTDTDTPPNVSQSDESNEGEQTAPIEPLVFTLLPDDTYAVIGLKTAIAHEIVIPSTYNGKSVTRIGLHIATSTK